MNANLSPQQAKNELWRRGNLSYKMDDVQKEIAKCIRDTDEKIFVVLCSRRLGKTYMGCLLAVETCLKKPNSIVKFLAASKLQVENFITPILREIFEDCPEALRPANVKSKYTYTFPNGSQIQLAGSDGGHAEKLRGSFSHLCIVDEAGFCRDLENTVRSILLPTTLSTKGKIILISTPPHEMDHDFMKFREEAETRGAYVKKTIYDTDRYTIEEINQMAAAYPGGTKSIEFRREFLCEIIRSVTDGSAVPEFDDALQAILVKETKKPAFYDCYVAMDIGGKDLTAVLFGYYDFLTSKIVVEDEIVMDFKEQHNTVKRLAEMIVKVEETRWTDPLTQEQKTPLIRVSDINYIVMDEIRRASQNKLMFVPVKKEDKEAVVNNLRVMLTSEKIIINPRCTNLIRHLKNVKWAKGKNIFARSPDNGHYDLVDALCYLARSVIYNKNPFPSYYNLNQKDLYILRDQPRGEDQIIKAFKKAFRVKEK